MGICFLQLIISGLQSVFQTLAASCMEEADHESGLVTEIREGIRQDKKTVREFHDCLFEEYRELLSGERNVLFRMKELWSYMAVNFTNYEKYAKKIKKSQHLSEYSSVVSSLFAEQDLID